MADKKISDMTVNTAAQVGVDTTYLPVVDTTATPASSQNKRMTLTEIAKASVQNALSFVHTGVGAVLRAVQDKLREIEVNANDYPGADLGAKINAADAALGATPGRIVVASGSATITTQIVLQNPDRTLEWGLGTYTFSVSATAGANGILVKADRCTVRGKSMFASILINGAASKDTVIHAFKGTYPGGTTLINNVVVENLTVDGNQSGITHNGNDTYENGINFDFAQNSVVRNCFVKNCVFQGIVLQGSGDGNSKNNRVTGCIVTGCGEYGIGLEGGTYDTIVDKNIVYSMATVPEVANGGAGIIVSQIGQTGTGNKVIGNIVDGCPSSGIVVQDGSDGCLVEGNTVRNCGTGANGGIGIDVSASTTSPSHVSIIGNVLKAASDKNNASIAVRSSATTVGYCDVIGNKIADNAGGGILVNSGKFITVASNIIRNVGTGVGATVTSGIRLVGSTANPTVTGNTIDTTVGNGVEVIAGTTNAVIKSDNTVTNASGSAYSDAGTNTVIEGLPVSFTPSWTASVNPTIGNGTLAGEYIVRPGGKTALTRIRMVAGTTTFFGTGAWKFSLPKTAATMTNLKAGVGGLRCLQTGTAYFVGVADVASAGTTTANLVTNSGDLTSASPFAWASTHELDIQFEYDLA